MGLYRNRRHLSIVDTKTDVQRSFIVKATIGKTKPERVTQQVYARNSSQAIIRFLESQEQPNVFRSIVAMPKKGC